MLWPTLLVMAAGRLAATAAARAPSRRWSWLTPTLTYWAVIVLVVAVGAPAGSLNRWFHAPGGGWGWPALVLGIGWSWVYLQTGSLWWPVAGHILTNLGAMAAPVFMGLCQPPLRLEA